MYLHQPELYHTTSEYESKPLYPSKYSPYNQIENSMYKTNQERISNSPPIILL